jgi:DNA-binding response OmpR family regulator
MFSFVKIIKVMDIPKRKVLVVDDDDNILDLLKTGLEVMGFQVNCAENTKSIRDIMKSFQPDIILMDANMPGEDGISFCRSLKHSPDTADVPVLILTAYSDPKTFNDAMLFGASDFLTKPFDIAQVNKKIEECISKARIKKGHQK